MIPRKTAEPPTCMTRTSLETLLSNSESPSFVVFRRSVDSTKYEQPKQDFTGLIIRGDAQKRQKPISPIHPVKRAKQEEEKEDIFDVCCSRIRENETRLKAGAGTNIDLCDMYTALCESSVSIPVPHTLLQETDSDTSTESVVVNKTSSIEDRRRALLHVFSRRYSTDVSDETLHLGAALLDKCLDLMSVEREKLTELAAVTLIVASKIEDVDCLTVSNIIEYELVETTTCIKMLAALERFVLASLAFNVTIPTPFNFANIMLVHLCAVQTTTYSAYYLLELSLLYVHNRLFPSDVVAYAATCLAFIMESNPGTSVTRVLRDTELKLRSFSDKHYEKKRAQSREVMRTLTDLPPTRSTRSIANTRHPAVATWRFDESLPIYRRRFEPIPPRLPRHHHHDLRFYFFIAFSFIS